MQRDEGVGAARGVAKRSAGFGWPRWRRGCINPARVPSTPAGWGVILGYPRSSHPRSDIVLPS